MQQQYDTIYKKTINGMEWLDHVSRTKEEIEKWGPKITQMFKEVTRLERMLRNDGRGTV